MTNFQTSNPPAPLSRTEAGKWLGGVCSGLARGRGIHAEWIRLAFIAGALLGGIGILVYLACWLIIPREGEQPEDPSSGWIVGAAQACAACAGIATLGVLAAVATLFGFGWIAVALAAVVLLGVLILWPRLGPGWALLPVAAIALPSAAVAASGVQLATRTGHVSVAPARLSVSGNPTYRAGLGTLLVDLRRTALPASGTVPLRIQGGVRRTIIALSADQCVRVELHYRLQPFLTQLASQVTGRQPRFTGVTVFGATQWRLSGTSRLSSAVPSPELKIDFSSTGGSLYVRDYPDSVDPELNPNWPGFEVYPEARPDTRGVPKRAARALIQHWRTRLSKELASKRLVDSLMPGPCAAGGAQG